MKKDYEKPELVFDSFELSQDIAAGCEFISNHVKGMCGVDTGVGILFSGELYSGACTMTPGPGFYDGVCYDVPSDMQNVFSS